MSIQCRAIKNADDAISLWASAIRSWCHAMSIRGLGMKS